MTNVFAWLLIGAIAFISFRMVWRLVTGKRIYRSPEAFVKAAILKFDTTNELDWKYVEHELLKSSPRSAQREIAYSLRIASVVHRIKTFKTLESRWMDVFYPNNGSGLILASGEPNYTEAVAAIKKAFHSKFHELEAAAMAKKTLSASARDQITSTRITLEI